MGKVQNTSMSFYYCWKVTGDCVFCTICWVAFLTNSPCSTAWQREWFQQCHDFCNSHLDVSNIVEFIFGASPLKNLLEIFRVSLLNASMTSLEETKPFFLPVTMCAIEEISLYIVTEHARKRGRKMALLNSFTKCYLKAGIIKMEYMGPLVFLKNSLYNVFSSHDCNIYSFYFKIYMNRKLNHKTFKKCHKAQNRFLHIFI